MAVRLAQIPIADICSELEDASTLIKAYNGNIDDAHDTLFRSWCTRLSAGFANATSANCRRLTASINLGPWTDAQKDDLIDIISKQKSTAKIPRRPGQLCLHFENLMLADSLVKCKDPTRFTQNGRLSVIASCARSINLINPCEKTRFHMVEILAYCEDNWEYAQKEVQRLMTKLKEYIQCSKVKNHLPYLEEFPFSANELPKELQIHAYGAEDNLPLVVHMPGVDGILNGRKKRGRDKVETLEWMKHVPEEHRAKVIGLVNKPTSTSSHTAIDGCSRLGMPTADMFRYGVPVKSEGGRYVKAEARVLPLIAPKIEEDAIDHEQDEPPDSADTSIIDMEQAMVSAFGTAKKIMRRPAAAAAKAAPVKKRPAGKIDMTHIFARLRARRPIGSLKCFTSRAYHPVRALAIKNGFSMDEAKAMAHEASSKASKMHAHLS